MRISFPPVLVCLALAACGEDHYLQRRADLQCSVSAQCNRGFGCPDPEDLEGYCQPFDEDAARDCIRELRRLNRELGRATEDEKDDMCEIPSVCADVYGGPCSD